MNSIGLNLYVHVVRRFKLEPQSELLESSSSSHVDVSDKETYENFNDEDYDYEETSHEAKRNCFGYSLFIVAAMVLSLWLLRAFWCVCQKWTLA